MLSSKTAIALFITTSLLSSLVDVGSTRVALGQPKPPRQTQSQPSAPVVKRKGKSKKAKHLIQEGIQQFNAQQFRSALSIFQQVQAEYPKLNKKERVTLLDYLGQTYLHIAEPDKANEVLEQALELYRDRKDKPKIAAALVNTARSYFKYPDEPKAIAYLEEAQKLYQELGDLAGQGNVLYGELLVDTYAGPFYHSKVRSENLERLLKALEFMQKGGDRHGEGRVLMAIGEAYYDTLDDYENSHASLRKALRIFQAEGDTYHEIISIWLIGYVYHAKEDYPKAIETYQKAIALAQQVGHIDTELHIHQYLGWTYQRLEQFPKAIAAFKVALQLAQDTNNRFEQGSMLQDLGSAYSEIQQYSDSISSYQQATLAFWENRGRQCKSDKEASLGEAYIRVRSRETYEEHGKKTTQYFEQALEIEQQQGTVECEFLILNKLEDQYSLDREIDKVITIANRTQEIIQTTSIDQIKKNQDLKSLLYSLASGISFAGHPQKYVQVLEISDRMAQKIGDKDISKKSLLELGRLYKGLGNTAKALDSYRQGFLLYGEGANLACTTNSLIAGGFANFELSQKDSWIPIIKEKDEAFAEYRQNAIKIWESALQDEDKGMCQIIIINQLNELYTDQVNFAKVQANLKQARAIIQTIPLAELRNSPGGKALVIFLKEEISSIESFIGLNNNLDGETTVDAIAELYQEALDIARKIDDKKLEFITLGELSSTYQSQEDYRKALEFSKEGLMLATEEFSLTGKVYFLNTLGSLYSFLGDYKQSNLSYEQSLTIQGQLSDEDGEIETIQRLAMNNYYQGDFNQAIKRSQNALEILTKRQSKESQYRSRIAQSISISRPSRASIDRPTRASISNSIKLLEVKLPSSLIQSYSYAALGQTDRALQIMDENIQSMETLGTSMNSFIDEYRKNVNPPQNDLTFEQIQKVVPLFEVFEDVIKFYRGDLYYQSGDLKQAMVDYQRGLDYTNIQSSFGRVANLGLARVYRDRQFPTVAVTYYKKVIRAIETTREDIQDLPEELQSSFLTSALDFNRTTVVDIYRELADLLISLGRIAEAQEVLELLKQKEIRDFTKGTRAETQLPDIDLNQVEQDINKKQQSLAQFGQKLRQCEIEDCAELATLQDQYDQLLLTFEQEMRVIEEQLGDRRLEQVSGGTEDFIASADRLLEAQPNSILIYPLVLKDKVRLLWASEGGIFSSKTCPLGESEAWTLITEFRELLSTPQSEITQVKTTGQKLYNCFVKPLESEITAGKIKNLIFVPDRATHYIPMGALYDGKQFLVEKFATSSVLSAGLTDVSDRLPDTVNSISTLALGVSDSVAGFSPLPNVSKELDAIVKEDKRDRKGIFPGSALLNQQFSKNTLRNSLNGQKILHIATHGEFIPEDPRASYLLMGTGEKFPIYQLQFLKNLRDVHLVVLSACETALGGPDQNGVEIAGISSYFLRDKAKAVLASLWQVNDESTNQFMQVFYQNLSSTDSGQPIGKGEALRRAQVSLLTGQEFSIKENQRGRVVIRDKKAEQKRNASTSFSHPYYWAPFTLIGNSR